MTHFDSCRLISSAASDPHSTIQQYTGPSAIPVVDISSWVTADGHVTARRKSAKELGCAFRSTGFALVIGHGVPTTIVHEMYSHMTAFFEGPELVKESILARPIHGAQGYHRQGHENVAQLLGDFSRKPDLVERLNFKNMHLALEDNNATATGSPGVGDGTAEPLKIPQTIGFRQATENYLDSVTRVWRALMMITESALGLPHGHMDAFHGQMRSTSLQMARYMNVSCDDDDGVLFGAHTDSGGFTILHTTAPGLEVQLADGWRQVPVMKDAFIINVGRLLSRWTNDEWLASVHRVRRHSGRMPKLSIAFFTSPRGDAMIEAIPGCVARGAEPKYKPIKASDFLYQRHLLHIPPDQRKAEHRDIPEEFWEAETALKRARIQDHKSPSA